MYIKKKADFWFSVAVILFSLSLLVQTLYIREGLVFGLGAADFPRGVLGVTILLAGILLLRSLSLGKMSPDAEDKKVPCFDKIFFRRVGFFAMMVAYIWLLVYVNYLALTIIFLVAGMYFLGKKDSKSIAVYCCVAGSVTFILYYVFVGLLQMFLP